MDEDNIFKNDTRQNAIAFEICKICDSAIFHGDTVYVSEIGNEIIGCENCVQKVFT